MNRQYGCLLMFLVLAHLTACSTTSSRPPEDVALRLTPWRDFRPADATPANRLRRFASNLLPAPLKRLVHGLVRQLGR